MLLRQGTAEETNLHKILGKFTAQITSQTY